jgi:hypothetical protein
MLFNIWCVKVVKVKNKIGVLVKDKYFWIGLVVLMAGLLLNYTSSSYLHDRYGETLPVLDDLILDNSPYLPLAWIYDFISIASVLLIIYYVYKKDYKKAPFVLLIYGLSSITRGFFIPLTPFGSPNGQAIGLFSGVTHIAGVYPSGHTGNAFLGFLLSKGIYRKIFLILTILTIFFLLIARGHYSIDIFSAILFNYAIYCFGKTYFNNFELGKH